MSPRDGFPIHDFRYAIELKTPEQIQRMRVAGALARETLLTAGKAVAPGVTTDEIDAIVHDFVISRGAYPSPLGYAGFPKSVAVSVNDVIAHGIPDDRPLENGDILNIDVTVFVEGHHGDTSCMFIVGETDPTSLALCRAAREAMVAGISVCGPGVDFREIGKQIDKVAEKADCWNVDMFMGHGIGSFFHGAPEVIHQRNQREQGEMLPGMTFTVEPCLVENNNKKHKTWDDGWTVQCASPNRSAQFEHTILITDTGYEILTGPCIDYEALAAQQQTKR